MRKFMRRPYRSERVAKERIADMEKLRKRKKDAIGSPLVLYPPQVFIDIVEEGME